MSDTTPDLATAPSSLAETKSSNSLAALTGGFATTVALSIVAYLGRLPGAELPNQVMLGLFLVILFLGGYWTGRGARSRSRAGLGAGLVTGLLSLTLLGSIIVTDDGTNEMRPNAILWVGGFLGLSCLSGLIGAAFARGSGAPLSSEAWVARFARTAAIATFALVLIGGVVTSAEAGLAVYDWPTSFEANMFLFPLSKMVGGVFYEHAHRLFGSLIGLTTIALCLVLFIWDRRGWLKGLSVFAVLLVIGQGILGGYRVRNADVSPAGGTDTTGALNLAVVHGVTGQLFFSLLVAIAVFVSLSWLHGTRHETPAAGKERRMGVALLGMLVLQLILGALLRHHGQSPWLLPHLFWAFAVAGHALFYGVRAQSKYPEVDRLRSAGSAMVALPIVQVVLGFAALLATSGAPENHTSTLSVWIATIHQAVGALFLATAVALTLWSFRLLQPGDAPTDGDPKDPQPKALQGAV